uniref:Uncharacterized protein n=1 Tax=Periophthalmus magnuspinnatus TaxID=409849 RepID=A0A3B4AMB3_9GOBI
MFFCIIMPSILTSPPLTSLHPDSILCDVDEFECLDRARCVPEAWLCDGEPDCPDASDESHQTCKSPIHLLYMQQNTHMHFVYGECLFSA